MTLFQVNYGRLFRLLDRLSGDPDLAADLAQETMVRLYRRGALPDSPEAWLVTVALNLFRNAKSTERRRRKLVSLVRGEQAHSDPAPPTDRQTFADDDRRRVRAAMDQLPEREQQLLLLRAEGYSYRDLALALELREASVGTLLARARLAFRQAFGEAADAP